MPNWCENRLIVEGAPERVRKFDKAFIGRPALWPLGEWETDGRTPEEVAELEAQKRKAWEESKPRHCFNALYPVPEEVLKVGYSAQDRGRIEDLFDPQKWYDGYSWCVSHWGTKWDLCRDGFYSSSSDGYAEYEFNTAWSPPCPWLKKVAADWPDLKFVLTYYEPGAWFAGKLVMEGGEVVEDVELVGNAAENFAMEEFGYAFWDQEGDE
jgi:hypothetical protein